MVVLIGSNDIIERDLRAQLPEHAGYAAIAEGLVEVIERITPIG